MTGPKRNLHFNNNDILNKPNRVVLETKVHFEVRRRGGRCVAVNINVIDTPEQTVSCWKNTFHVESRTLNPTMMYIIIWAPFFVSSSWPHTLTLTPNPPPTSEIKCMFITRDARVFTDLLCARNYRRCVRFVLCFTCIHSNLVPRACDPREGTWGSGIIRCRKPGILAKTELRIPYQRPIRFLPEMDYPRASRWLWVRDCTIAGSGNEIAFTDAYFSHQSFCEICMGIPTKYLFGSCMAF